MKTNFLLLFLTIFLTTNLFAQTVHVESVTGPDLSEGERFSIKELIEAEVSKHDGYYTVKSDGKIMLSPSALKLGDTAFLKLKVSKTGEKVRSVKMKTNNFDDIDKVIDRLVTAALEDEEVDETANLKNISQSEANRYSVRYQATKQWIFGFGPTVLANSGSDDSGYYFNFGCNWQMHPQWSMQLGWDFATLESSDADFNLLSLGVNYYFKDASSSPYFGIDFGYGSADADVCTEEFLGACYGNDTTSGWGASAKIGWQFFRTSTVNLGIEAKYSTLFDSHSQGTPGRASLSISAYY